MHRASSSSKTYLLLDYVQRLERHREERRAVHIHLSQLKAQNRQERHLRITENTFDNLTKQFDGQVFGMQNGDIVYIGREITLADIDDAVQRLRVLFGDDPLAQSIDAGTEDLFCTYYNVDTQYTTLLEVVERLYNEEQRRIKRLQMVAEQSGDASNFWAAPICRASCGVNRSVRLRAPTCRGRFSRNFSFRLESWRNWYCRRQSGGQPLVVPTFD